MVTLGFQTPMWPRLKPTDESPLPARRETFYDQLLPYEPAHRTGGLAYSAEGGMPLWK